MINILIRDLSPEVVDRLDKRAADVGLSRNEFLRRQLNAVAAESPRRATVEGLARLSYLARDVLDDEVMRGARD